VLEYITHGISKVPPAGPPSDDDTPGDAEAGFGEAGTATSRDPLSAYAASLTARARAGELDPLIGRRDELERTLENSLPPPQEQPRVRRRRRRWQDRAG
jgi:ATP-dependent Clp protease ATP-binding subunit ClpA